MNEEQLRSITNELDEWGEVPDGVVDALVDEVRRLRDGIEKHRTDSVELLDRPTTSIDLALWSLLDGAR